MVGEVGTVAARAFPDLEQGLKKLDEKKDEKKERQGRKREKEGKLGCMLAAAPAKGEAGRSVKRKLRLLSHSVEF